MGQGPTGPGQGEGEPQKFGAPPDREGVGGLAVQERERLAMSPGDPAPGAKVSS